MSKKDFNFYYLQIETQYLNYIKILEQLKDVKSVSLENKEKFDQIMLDTMQIKRDFDIIAQAAYFLNMPKNKKMLKKVMSKSYYEGYENYFKRMGVDTEAMHNENKNVLDNFQEIVDAIKRESELYDK